MLGTVRGNLVQAAEGITAQYSEAARYLLLRLTENRSRAVASFTIVLAV